MRLLLAMLLLAVPVLADECTDACDAALVEDLAYCEWEYDQLWPICYNDWTDTSECDYQHYLCMIEADGDPEAEAVCDSIYEDCVDYIEDQFVLCMEEFDAWRLACIADAQQDHVFCIEQCEGTPTRRRSWSTVKVLY